MIPTRISVSNFLSYSQAEVDLRGLSMVAYAGDNGAGKSALAVDALTWALWGESRARSDDDLVRAGAEECTATVDIQTDKGEYRISRRRRLPGGGRAGASTLTFEILEGGVAHKLTAETIKETQDLIDRVLGLGGRTFVNTACLVQGRADEFARAGPKDRKDLLTEILGLGVWQEWADRARARRRDADGAVKAAQDSAVALRQILEGAGDVKGRLRELEQQVEGLRAQGEEWSRRVTEARSLADAQRDTLAMRDTLRADLGHLETQERQGRGQITALERQLGAIPKAAGAGLARQCPTCGQVIADPGAAARLETWNTEQSERRAMLESDLAQVHRQTDDAVVKAGQTREALTRTELEIEGTGDMRAALASAEAGEKDCGGRLATARADAAGLRGRIDELASFERKIVEHEETAKRASVRVADLLTIETALGPNGIQAMLIDGAIPEIVDEANRLLDILTGGLTTIDLRTQRAGKTTGRDIETLDLLISDALGTRPYELYSGGERFRVDFATRIALSRLLARRASAPCRTLIIDEGFGSQDGQGREALMECLSMIAAEFGLIEVISHVDDLRDALPATIRVEKTAGGSRAILS